MESKDILRVYKVRLARKDPEALTNRIFIGTSLTDVEETIKKVFQRYEVVELTQHPNPVITTNARELLKFWFCKEHQDKEHQDEHGTVSET